MLSLNLTKQSFSDFAIRLFYALGICVIIRFYSQFSLNSAHLSSAQWIWPVRWFDFLSLSPETFIYFYLYVFTSFCLVFVAPRSFAIRLNGAYSWLVFIGSIYSFGKVDHTVLGWPVTAWLFLFFNPSQVRRERFYIYLMQCYILSNYFAAGLWKLRCMLQEDFLSEPWQMLKRILLQQMAIGILEGSRELTFVYTFVANHERLAAVSWILVVLLQLSAILGIFFSENIWFWGVLFILFHLGTQLLMGITFYEQTILIVFVFYFLPSLKNVFDSKSAIA